MEFLARVTSFQRQLCTAQGRIDFWGQLAVSVRDMVTPWVFAIL